MCVINFVHEHGSMNLVESDNMNELTTWMELDHIVDLHHTIKSTTWLIAMLKGVKLRNMDKIDNIHDNRNIKNCDSMNHTIGTRQYWLQQHIHKST
jgi:hypothetical protein